MKNYIFNENRYLTDLPFKIQTSVTLLDSKLILKIFLGTCSKNYGIVCSIMVTNAIYKQKKLNTPTLKLLQSVLANIVHIM